jgi:ribosome-binding factor A
MQELPSHRQLKVGETIKRELSLILSKELNEPYFESLFLTITEVKMSPDLTVAWAYVVALSGKAVDQKKLITYLNTIAFKIRSLINKKVKLRVSPEIRFKYDTTFDQVSKISKLLDE